MLLKKKLRSATHKLCGPFLHLFLNPDAPNAYTFCEAGANTNRDTPLDYYLTKESEYVYFFLIEEECRVCRVGRGIPCDPAQPSISSRLFGKEKSTSDFSPSTVTEAPSATI